MPRHAIATGLVDEVLSVDQMPARILAYKATMGQLALPDQPIEEPLSDEDALRGVLTQVRLRTGHDFSNYKRGTVLRRISRRMGVRQVPTLSGYATFIRDHVDEPIVLLRDLLI